MSKLCKAVVSAFIQPQPGEGLLPALSMTQYRGQGVYQNNGDWWKSLSTPLRNSISSMYQHG